MSSKGLRAVLFLVGLLGAIAACTPKVGEAPPPVKEQSLESLNCVGDLKTVFKDFTRGEASDQQVAAMWDCSADAIKSFKRYVYGRTEDRFEPDEIAKFLQDDFLPKDAPAITPELQKQVMHFKRLFLGGSGESVTRAELDKLVDVLQQFKSFSLRLNPSMKLLTKAWVPAQFHTKASEQIQHFETASQEVQSVAEELAEMIVANDQSYDFANFPIFIRELDRFSGEPNGADRLVAQFIPTVQKIKVAVAGGNETRVEKNEWRNFNAISARSYLQYLRYYYFVEKAPPSKDAEENATARADYLVRSLEDFSKGFEHWIARKPVNEACDTRTLKAVSCITRDEMSATFKEFEKVFAGFHFSDKLLQEVMKLKVVYFGGSPESFTSQDFGRGGNKFKLLHDSLQKVLPYYSVYLLEWNPKSLPPAEAKERLQLADVGLKAAAADLGALFEQPYDLQSLKELLREWNRLYPDAGHDGFDLGRQLAKYLPLVKDVKNTIFSDGDSIVRSAQWAPFLNLSAQSYSSFLYYKYFLERESSGTSAFLEGFKGLSEQVSGVLAEILNMNKNHVLSSGQVQQLVARLAELEMMPQGISAGSLQKLVDVLIERVVWPTESRLRGVRSPGFNLTGLQNLRRELQIWYETERYFYQLARQSLSHGELQNEIAKKYRQSGLSPFLKAGLGESSLVLSGSVPKVVDSKQRLIISRSKRPNYDVQSLSQLNLHRAMGRLVIRAAIESRERLDANLGLNLQEAQALFHRVRPALEDLAYLDRKNLTFIESRFRESNVFSPHSNGDTLSNFQEVTDIVGMIYSGAIINAAFRKNIVATCGVRLRPGQDVAVAESCVYSVYYKRTTEHMASMPQYLKIYRTWDESQWQGFFGHILKATGHVPNANGTVQLSTLNLVPHVFQYMEMLYARFDADQNEVIDTQEALEAYPSFSGLLAELTKDESLIKPADLPALFTYILHYGAPPGGVKDYFFRWLPWKRNRASWTVSADRMKLAQIFSFIAEKTRASDKSVVTGEQQIIADPKFRTYSTETASPSGIDSMTAPERPTAEDFITEEQSTNTVSGF